VRPDESPNKQFLDEITPTMGLPQGFAPGETGFRGQFARLQS